MTKYPPERTATLLNFGQLLKLKREQMNLNLQEASKRIGIGYSTLNKWEKNQAPRASLLPKLCKFYHLTDEELRAYKIDPSEGRDRDASVHLLIEDIRALKLRIESTMNGLSSFERRIKAMGLTALNEAQNLLSSVLIIDEALK